MIRIEQKFDADEIRKLSYEKDLYCIRDSNEPGMMDKLKMCKVPPESINKLLDDPGNMFVIFTKNE